MRRASLLDRIVAGPAPVADRVVRAAVRDLALAPPIIEAPIEQHVDQPSQVRSDAPGVVGVPARAEPEPTPAPIAMPPRRPVHHSEAPQLPAPRAEHKVEHRVRPPAVARESVRVVPAQDATRASAGPRESARPAATMAREQPLPAVSSPPQPRRDSEPEPPRPNPVPASEPTRAPAQSREVSRVEKTIHTIEHHTETVRVDAPARVVPAPREDIPEPPLAKAVVAAAGHAEPRTPPPTVERDANTTTVVREVAAVRAPITKESRPQPPQRPMSVTPVVPRPPPVVAARAPVQLRPRIDIQIGTLEIRTTSPARRPEPRRIVARPHAVALDGEH